MKTSALTLQHHLTNCMRLFAVMLLLTYTYTTTAQTTDTLKPSTTEKKWGVGVMVGTPISYLNTGLFNPNSFYESGTTKNISYSTGINIKYKSNRNIFHSRISFSNYLDKSTYNSNTNSPVDNQIQVSQRDVRQKTYTISLGYNNKIYNYSHFSIQLGIELFYYLYTAAKDHRISTYYDNNDISYKTINTTKLIPINASGINTCANISYGIYKNISVDIDLIFGAGIYFGKDNRSNYSFSNQNNIISEYNSSNYVVLSKIDLTKPQMFLTISNYF